MAIGPFEFEHSVPSSTKLYCLDADRIRINNGERYMPESDPCKTCQCDKGFPVLCQSVLCSPPSCRPFEQIAKKCCTFVCLDINNGTDLEPAIKDYDKTNLGIRLAASMVTSMLVIALLVFMIHRLRQRHLLINIRHDSLMITKSIAVDDLNSMRRQSDDDIQPYMTNIDNVDLGFEYPPYDDPPPRYSPPKPLDRLPSDSPPPYEENPDTNPDVNLSSTMPQNGCPQVASSALEVSVDQSGGTSPGFQSFSIQVCVPSPSYRSNEEIPLGMQESCVGIRDESTVMTRSLDSAAVRKTLKGQYSKKRICADNAKKRLSDNSAFRLFKRNEDAPQPSAATTNEFEMTVLHKSYDVRVHEESLNSARNYSTFGHRRKCNNRGDEIRHSSNFECATSSHGKKNRHPETTQNTTEAKQLMGDDTHNQSSDGLMQRSAPEMSFPSECSVFEGLMPPKKFRVKIDDSSLQLFSKTLKSKCKHGVRKERLELRPLSCGEVKHGNASLEKCRRSLDPVDLKCLQMKRDPYDRCPNTSNNRSESDGGEYQDKILGSTGMENDDTTKNFSSTDNKATICSIDFAQAGGLAKGSRMSKSVLESQDFSRCTRSGSLTSQASIFSICSETGEKKRTKCTSGKPRIHNGSVSSYKVGENSASCSKPAACTLAEASCSSDKNVSGYEDESGNHHQDVLQSSCHFPAKKSVKRQPTLTSWKNISKDMDSKKELNEGGIHDNAPRNSRFSDMRKSENDKCGTFKVLRSDRYKTPRENCFVDVTPGKLRNVDRASCCSFKQYGFIDGDPDEIVGRTADSSNTPTDGKSNRKAGDHKAKVKFQLVEPEALFDGKEYQNSKKRRKSKHIETFEYLIGKILLQFEAMEAERGRRNHQQNKRRVVGMYHKSRLPSGNHSDLESTDFCKLVDNQRHCSMPNSLPSIDNFTRASLNTEDLDVINSNMSDEQYNDNFRTRTVVSSNSGQSFDKTAND